VQMTAGLGHLQIRRQLLCPPPKKERKQVGLTVTLGWEKGEEKVRPNEEGTNEE